jgi:regulator of protease activity HflC (stomatin/prohibitin superfamily)
MSESCLCFASVVVAILTSLSVIKVPEGHVAVYFRGGALLTHTDNPGYHAVFPIVTQTAFVQTSVQTDNVLKIPCGTSGGTMIHFARIEVVNQLARDTVYSTVKNYTVDYDKTWIYDKIHHEINQICSRSTLEEMYITKFDTLDETLRDALQHDINAYAPGIQIIAIRVTKPSIPEAIRLNYEAIEAERTKHMVAVETRRVVEQNAQTEKRKAIIDAEKVSEVANIQNAMHMAKAKSDADAHHYAVQRQADSNKLLHTPEMIQIESIRAMSDNTKIYFGDKIPSVFSMSSFPV